VLLHIRKQFSMFEAGAAVGLRVEMPHHHNRFAHCVFHCAIHFLWILYTFIVLALGLGSGSGLVRVTVRVSVRLKVSIMWQNTIIMVAYYIMLARPVGRFFTVLRMNFPVMLIAEDICGLRLGLCRYADIGIGLAPRVCLYLQHMGYRYGQTYLRYLCPYL